MYETIVEHDNHVTTTAFDSLERAVRHAKNTGRAWIVRDISTGTVVEWSDDTDCERIMREITTYENLNWSKVEDLTEMETDMTDTLTPDQLQAEIKSLAERLNTLSERAKASGWNIAVMERSAPLARAAPYFKITAAATMSS